MISHNLFSIIRKDRYLYHNTQYFYAIFNFIMFSFVSIILWYRKKDGILTINQLMINSDMEYMENWCKYFPVIRNISTYYPNNFYQCLNKHCIGSSTLFLFAESTVRLQPVRRHNSYLPASISGYAVALTSIVLFA